MKLDSAVHHIWKADIYSQHSSIQQNAATNILNLLKIKPDNHILDVGCGDGKITAHLASHVSQGSVLGIDISFEMINFAQKKFPKAQYPNLNFSLQDAQFLNYEAIFDIIFSSFALQWLPDKSSFFKKAYNSLKPSGLMAITIPLGISIALEQAISELTTSKDWKDYFINFLPGWHIANELEFSRLIVKNHFLPFRFAVEPVEVVFSSRADFEKYVIPWFTYLNPLPESLKQIFFNRIIDRYLEIEPPTENGSVHFQFDRLGILAVKNHD